MNGIARFATAAFVLSLIGCGGKAVYKPAPGTEVYELDNLLQAEVVVVRANYGRKKIETEIRLRNKGTDGTIHFSRNAVSISYQGTSFYARDLRVYENDVDVRPGESKGKYWAFHVEEPPMAGEYELKIAGIKIQKIDSDLPLGKDLTFKIKVPARE